MKIILITILILGFGINETFTQNLDDSWNYLLIREDVVKPFMTDEYEGALADISYLLKENKIDKVNYFTHLHDNYRYSHMTILNDPKEIIGGLRSFIEGEKQTVAFQLAWSYLNDALESYHSYVVEYMPELSPVPDGNLWLENAPYRRWNYYYIKPGSEKEIDDILAAWKGMYEEKRVKTGYRVYKGVIGIERPIIIFTTWAESPLDYQINLADNIEKLGEDATVLWEAMMDHVRKVETIEGWYLPQYSYQPDKM